MHHIRRLFALAAILGLVSLLGVEPAFAADQPKRGGTLVIGGTESPRSLNGAIQAGAETAMPSTNYSRAWFVLT